MKLKLIYVLMLSFFASAISFGGQNSLCSKYKCCNAAKPVKNIIAEEEVKPDDLLVTPIIPIIPGTII